MNWDMAKDIARQTVAQGTADGTKDASVGPAERAAVEEAVRLADLWLDDATSLPSGAGTRRGVEPRGVGRGDPAGVEGARRPGRRARRRWPWATCCPRRCRPWPGPLLGHDALDGRRHVRHADRAGRRRARRRGRRLHRHRPAARPGRQGRAAAGRTSRRSARASASRRTRCGSTWPCARPPTSGSSRTCRGCARTCSARSRDTRAASRSTPPSWRTWSASSTRSNPEQLQEALQQGMFQPEDTPEQKAALARLETALALVEGWVDAVVHAAAKPRLPSADALRETLRRRRATGGPAEQTFATLIGLELRPRRLRDASRLWASLTDARGVDGRDGAVGAPGHAADGRGPGRPGRLRAPRAAGLLRAGQDARRGRGRRRSAAARAPTSRRRPSTDRTSGRRRRDGEPSQGPTTALTATAVSLHDDARVLEWWPAPTSDQERLRQAYLGPSGRASRTACGRPAGTATSRRAPW